MSHRGAILSLAVVMLVSSQCFALCSLSPCTTIPAETSSNCHNKPAPTDSQRENAPCGHQQFLTEGVPPVGVFVPDIGMTFADLPVYCSEASPLPRIQGLNAHSPPQSLLDAPFTTTLRI